VGGMRILYVAMKYDYGFPVRGYSFEHWNFYDSLMHMGHEVIYFDFKSLYNELGRKAMNDRLWQVVREEAPELLFCVLFEEELDKDVVRRISRETDTLTLNWFCDDHWRFESFTRHWAENFNWVVTTASSAVPKYAAMGYKNVIKSQWGLNHFLYRRFEIPLRYGVSFVGQPHGNRWAIIDGLRRAGVDVHTWGLGWESGRLEQDEMIRVFNQSRINLNLSNASTSGARAEGPMWLTRLRGNAGRVLIRNQLGRNLRTWTRDRARGRAGAAAYQDQIKARNFEIPGCGGMQLTGRAEGLEAYFEPDKEIVVFESEADLVEKARYYLAHEEARRAIADAGHMRALRDHTYELRFTEIFRTIGAMR